MSNIPPIRHPWFFAHYERGLFYFRLFGWGLKLKDSRHQRLTFSEENRVGNSHKLGRFYWQVLRRD